MNLWNNPELPAQDRVEALLSVMTLPEKIAQLGSVWPQPEADGGHDVPPTAQDDGGGHGAGAVAPLENALAAASDQETALRHGIGHLTRPFGTRPVSPAQGRSELVALQGTLQEQTRLGIPALAHEECLTGFATYGATVYPTSLAWAATFDPDLIERMATAIGQDMSSMGVHQGLSPVLDVVRDHRWGRVEETMGEDPYLVGVLGTAYVQGLQSAGVIATLKHFAGHSASRGARNHGPVSIGPREMADVMLPPFEMAVRTGRAGSVMNSYTDQDGVPAASDGSLLTGVLRDQWGFDGTVVSDYGAVVFLRLMHRVAATEADAGALALTAGIDVELPNTRCYGEALERMVTDGRVPEKLVDRSVTRVLLQKAALGLLDDGWSPETAVGTGETPTLDSHRHRALAREIGERSVTLLANDGVLPCDSGRPSSLALIGPCADDPAAFMGCYSFPNHVLPRYPELGMGLAVPSLREALAAEFPRASLTYEPGCPLREADRSGIPAAVAAASGADLAVVAVGDRAGMFGAGTSGEGCDAPDLALPGIQGELVRAVQAAGTPVVLVVVSGRPYALGDYAQNCAAMVQAFMPGEEGGAAVSSVLSGRTVPSGKLPVQIPATAGSQPGTYLSPPLGLHSEGISNLDNRPLFPFGHGMSYTTFDYREFALEADRIGTDGTVEVSCLVRNTGTRTGRETVQLYFSDPLAQVARPVKMLAGFASVLLEAGEEARVGFRLHADLTSYTAPDGERIVEAGSIHLLLGSSSADIRLRGEVTLTGENRVVGPGRQLTTTARVSRARHVGQPPTATDRGPANR